MENENLKKVMIGARMPAGLVEQFKQETTKLNLTTTQLLEKILTDYFTGETKVVEKVVEVPRPVGDWEIDLLQCNTRVLASFLEVADSRKMNKIQILETFVSFIESETGAVKEKYINLAKDIKTK